MNRDEIFRMAREAEIIYTPHTGTMLERFAKLVAAHEREECAKIAFNARTYIQAAKDIRARGTNEIRNP
jgi:hypothetical protein